MFIQGVDDHEEETDPLMALIYCSIEFPLLLNFQLLSLSFQSESKVPVLFKGFELYQPPTNEERGHID